MIRALRKFFERTQVERAPRAVVGREVSFAAGYSLLELERAGISEEQAASAGLVIDRERDSALGENVLQLDRLRAAHDWKRG